MSNGALHCKSAPLIFVQRTDPTNQSRFKLVTRMDPNQKEAGKDSPQVKNKSFSHGSQFRIQISFIEDLTKASVQSKTYINCHVYNNHPAASLVSGIACPERTSNF